MTIRPELLEQLRGKRVRLTGNVGADKLAELHAQGRLSARERIDALCVAGSFQEFGLHATHNATHFGMARRNLPADGVVLQGESWVDESLLTGESKPLHKAEGSAVVAGPWAGSEPAHSPADQAELDLLLDKIGAQGMDSLSRNEKARLNELSKKLRGR